MHPGLALGYIAEVDNPSNPIHALLVSGSLAALIGLVRQWSFEREHRGESAKAGLRTFTAWGLLGAAAGLLERAGVAWALAAVLLAFTVVLAMVYIGEGKHHLLGLTTLSVGLVTFTIGAMVAYEIYVPAVMTSAAVMLILGIKHWSHGWTRRWKEADLRCLLQFVAITGIVLPLAPNEDYGPYGGFNPYKIWLMVVLVASLGFLGYIAIRWLGAQAGIMVTGLAGGLASSTATTLAMSRESRRMPLASGRLALAVVLACTVMLGRLTVMMVLISPELALATLWPFVLMAVPGAAWGLREWRREAPDKKVSTPDLGNPLGLRLALQFGLLYAAVSFLTRWAVAHMPVGWMYGISFVSGLADAAPVTLSSAQAVSGHLLTTAVAARCVLLAALSNTLVKAGLALALGAPAYRRAIAVALGAVFVFGLAGLWLF